MSAAPVLSNTISFRPEVAADRAAAEALVLDVFGPGRFAKTAERLRERAVMAAGFIAHDDGRVVGSVRLWSITVGGLDALFLGAVGSGASGLNPYRWTRRRPGPYVDAIVIAPRRREIPAFRIWKLDPGLRRGARWVE